MNKPAILLLPEKTDPETDEVRIVCEKYGIKVKRLGKYWIKDDELTNYSISVYGNQVFCMVLEQVYGLTLISPSDSLITTIAETWTKRTIRQTKISRLVAADFPAFIKPVIPKLFTAGVFYNITAFTEKITGISHDEDIQVSSIIPGLQAEARAWVMNGEIKDIALYEGDADLTGAADFLKSFLAANKSLLPPVIVTDLAFSTAAGWCILEFNACWGAGLNNCNAEKIIDCILTATINP